MDQHNFSDEQPKPVSGQFWEQFSEQWQEILAGYALGALEPDEMLAVEEYLAEHPELASTMQRLEESVMGLAYSAPAITPPPDSKAALMARVRADLHEPTPTAQRAAPSSAQPPRINRLTGMAQATRVASRAPRSTMRRATTWRQRFADSFDGFFDFATGWKLATMTTAAALLFFAVSTVQLSSQLNQSSAQVTLLNEAVSTRTAELNTATSQLTDVASLQDELAQLQAEKATLQQSSQQVVQQLETERQQISSLLAVSQVVTLDGTDAAPQAEGTLFVGEDSLVLVIRGLQPLPSGQIYQLWLIPEESNPVSAGLVQIATGESPSLTTDVNLSISSFAVVGLSVEPEGGSEQPTGDIVMLGDRT